MSEPEGEGCCFDDWVDHWSARARRKPTVAGVTGPLLEAMVEAGIAERTVLDLGCGIGDLSIEAVRAGAAGARGYDLSPRAIAAARDLAAERGVADRTTFEIGDGARVELPSADVVVLNRVFCCYPDVRSLLERSLAAAGSVYAFTVPRSTGLAGRIARAQTAASNVWYRLRSSKFGGFRVYIHDIGRIDARVRAEGFEPLRREHRRFAWDLAVYRRDGAAGRPGSAGEETNDQRRETASNPSRS
ncbi:MAG: class I SAM-dependent methyltransferase [Actinomycetota bacterium]